MRRTPIASRKFRLKSGLLHNHPLMGVKHSGFETPYSMWRWRQDALFRHIFESQTTHLRKVYRRQWYEAYVANADECIAKYNITKAATMAQWEQEMESQEEKRREGFEMAEGRQLLKNKHLDLLREKREREFFHWYERASERLQYMAETMKFVTRSNLDAHIEAELAKYQVEDDSTDEASRKTYPLNFVGQMPYLEDADLNIVAASRHHIGRIRADRPDGEFDLYDPPSIVAAVADETETPVSAQVHALDDDAAATLTKVFDDMADEESDNDGVEIGEHLSTLDDVEDATRLQTARDKSKHGATSVRFRQTPAARDAGSPTIADTKKMAQSSKRKARDKLRRGSGDRQARLAHKNMQALQQQQQQSGPRPDVRETAPGAPIDQKQTADPAIGEIRAQKMQRMSIDPEKLAKAREVSEGRSARGRATSAKKPAAAPRQHSGPTGGGAPPGGKDDQ